MTGEGAPAISRELAMIPWGLRRRLWNLIAISKYRANRPVAIPVPVGNDRPITDVSFVSQFPGIPIHNIRVADRVPADEASRLKYYFYEFQVAMYRLLPPMQPGLPDMAESPDQALFEAYTAAHRRCFPVPVLPPPFPESYWLPEPRPPVAAYEPKNGCALNDSVGCAKSVQSLPTATDM